MYHTIFFDLDGTLTDSGLGITNSVAYALKKFGIDETDREKLFKFVGPPLRESLGKYYDFSEEKSEQAIAYYREYYKDKGIFENEVYEGVEELLIKLRESGHKLVVATAKPEKFARIVLEHFDLAKYFDLIAGASMDATRTKKTEVIAYALKQCAITDCAQVVMVGDREDDIKGAKENGMDSIGVLYGYGDLEELQDAGAVYIAEKAEDILKFV